MPDTTQPVTIASIREGRFAEQLDDQVAVARKTLVAFKREHGDRARKAKVVVTASITMIIDDNETVFVRDAITLKTPACPTLNSIAFIADGDVKSQYHGTDNHPHPQDPPLPNIFEKLAGDESQVGKRAAANDE